MAVLRGRERYQPRAPFRTYLFGIAFKQLAAERRKSRRPEAELSGREVAVPGIADTSYWVREALKKLEEAEREILMLREYEQLSYAEIGDLLRIPVNTVRSRLFRARLTLKRLLEPNSETIAAEGRA